MPTKVALVTGANKGIGLEIARQLATRGFTVFLGARNPKLGEAAAANLRSENLDARSLDLDLTQPQTSTAAARTIQNDFQHLDVLVNNAAIVDAADGPPGAVDLAVVRRVMETKGLPQGTPSRAAFPITANVSGTVEFGTPVGVQISVLGFRFPASEAFSTIPVLAP